MMVRVVALVGLVALGSCGGVSGEIGEACVASPRGGASARTCGCVQGVANRMLSGSDQARVAAFFDDPDRAQALRVRDDAASEALWRRYRAFADRAAAVCR